MSFIWTVMCRLPLNLENITRSERSSKRQVRGRGKVGRCILKLVEEDVEYK